MSEQVEGTVKWFNDEKGFGFIERENEDKDLFFHSNSLEGVTFDELEVGTAVTFTVVNGDKGPAAENVKLA